MAPSIPKNRARIDVYLPADQEKRFKEEVFKRKGMKKGNISEAVEEAIILWIGVNPSKSTRTGRKDTSRSKEKQHS